jgi:hypothetical protein
MVVFEDADVAKKQQCGKASTPFGHGHRKGDPHPEKN